MTVYYIKYALTSGVVTREIDSTGSDKSVIFKKEPGEWGLQFGYPGKDTFNTMAEAIAAAEKMRDRKIASVEKQLKKLRAMSFR